MGLAADKRGFFFAFIRAHPGSNYQAISWHPLPGALFHILMNDQAQASANSPINPAIIRPNVLE